MHVYFDAPHAAEPATTSDRYPATTGRLPLLSISPEVLRRHGARVLEPERAVLLPPDPDSHGPADPPPHPTIYRYGTLLLPVRPLSQDEKTVETLNGMLADSGMRLVGRPEQFRSLDRRDASTPPTARVALEVASSDKPAAVDAWVALQTLRARVRAARGKAPAAVAAVVEEASLEHLFLGAGIGAYQDPTGAWQGSPIGTGGAVASYLTPAFGARTPVAVVAPRPPRRNLRRRPVVVVLDTGIAENPWLRIPASGGLPPEGPVRVDEALQDIVRASTTPVSAAGGPLQPIDDQWDTPVTDEPLVGEVDSHTGHGVFIAGLIAQIAPDADVLSVRLMHSDGIVYEQTVLAVLDELIHRVEKVQDGQQSDASQAVDMVAVSFGYYDETADNQAATPLLRQRLQRLVDRGVLVAASAGNDAATRPFYPAALSTQLASPLMRSVGALNPNGTATLFSNDGGAVNTWATGALVVSTFPLVEGSRRPANSVAPRPGANGRLPSRREALDPDSFSHGWAAWSGASFAAPIAAAVLANKLIENSENRVGPELISLTQEDTMKRARAAVQGAISDTDTRPPGR